MDLSTLFPDFPIARAEAFVAVKVSDNDFDNFILEQYGRHFEFAMDRESPNDTTHEFDVEKEDMDTYDQEKLDNWKAGSREYYMTRTLLTDLCNRGILPDCKLLIRVCW